MCILAVMDYSVARKRSYNLLIPLFKGYDALDLDTVRVVGRISVAGALFVGVVVALSHKYRNIGFLE